MHCCHDHNNYGHKHKHKRMTCQVGSTGHSIKLTTPKISDAVAGVISTKCGALLGELHKANGFFEQAKQAAEQAMMQGKEWRNERSEQHSYNKTAQEKVAEEAEKLNEGIKKKEDLVAQLGG